MRKGILKKGLYNLIILVLLVAFSLPSSQVFLADEKEVVRVGVYPLAGFHALNEEGELEGFCLDYLKLIGAVNDWEFEYVLFDDFMEACNMLEAGQVDLVGPAMASDERKEKFAFSELYFGTEYTVLATSQDRTDLYYEDYADFEGKRIGVLNGYPLTEYFITYMQMHGFSSELVYFDSVEESKQALDAGQVDAIVDSIMDIGSDYRILAKFSPQPIYFMTNKNDIKFLAELNEAMDQVHNSYPYMLEEILYYYYPMYKEQFYTKQEIEYVQQQKVIKIAYVADRRPLSYTDSNGEFQGISRALFDKIAEVSGLKFEYVELPGGEVTYETLMANAFDLLTGVEYNTVNMGSDTIFLSRPYISTSKVFVSHKDFVYDPNQTYTVATPDASNAIKKVITQKYPNVNIVEYPSSISCFAALYREEVDMLIHNQYVVDSILAKPIFDNFRVVSLEGMENELSFAAFPNAKADVASGEIEGKLLISIINKAIAQIPESELDNILMKESAAHKYEVDVLDFLYTYRYTVFAAIIFGTVIAAFSFFYSRERSENARLQAEEVRRTAVQKKRYETIIECSDDLIYEINLNGEPSISSDKIKKKFGWEFPLQIEEMNVAQAMSFFHIHPEDEEIFKQILPEVGSDKFEERVLRIGKANGDYLWCRLYMTVLTDENKNVISVLGKIVDVDEEVKEKQQLEHKSRTDMLSGLLNKQTFEKEVRDYIDHNSANAACYIFIDMDYFKDINDKFGHSVGDQVIKEVAKKIQLLFANFDLVGRFGGDEFCVFVKEIPRDTLIDRLRFAVKKMEQEYTYDGVTVKISASIGAAYCKREHIGYKEFMNAADAAAYQAKDNGRNCYIIRDVE